ncbi:MAG: SDR family NAD(P)-dependent oxidoreductase, partial [Chloroflexota bacterium]
MTPTLTDQQVLVTGATGFLGSALTVRLAADGVRVRSLARNPGKARFLREHGIEVFEGDVTDRAAMRQAVQGCRVVFHVAASLGGSYAQGQAVN